MDLKEVVSFRPRRAGYAVAGAPTNINVRRTMRNSYGRRLALGRPKQTELDEIAAEIAALEANPDPGMEIRLRIASLRQDLDRLMRRRKVVAYVDPVDIRFNRFEPQPLPNANAVMFCLMDVSSSMGEREKDLAKRFFVLLHLFLKRRYERTDVVFIRHTHEAREVDEDTFFYSTQSGGTVVSTALEEMRRIIHEQPQLEHLCRASIRWRQRRHRLRILRRAPRRGPDAPLPILCLCRDHRRAREPYLPIGRERDRALARLSPRRSELAKLPDDTHRQAGRHLPGFQETVFQAASWMKAIGRHGT
jgi:Protein of unknown function (DUF444)